MDYVRGSIMVLKEETMKHAISIAIAWILLAGLVCSAAEIAWTETEASHSVTSHPKTGEPILTFTVWMEYDEAPRCIALRTEWTISAIGGTSEEILVTDVRPLRRSCAGIKKFFSLSPAVEAIPGEHYHATLLLEDEENELVYTRSFDYIMPDELPAGSRFEKSGETPTVDLGGVPEGVLGRLAEYFDVLSADYKEVATGVSLADFFSSYAASKADFPVFIFVVPVSEASLTAGEGDTSFTGQINRLLLFFTVPFLNAGNVVVQQLESDEEEGEAEIVGRVFVRKNDSSLGAVTVFVHEAAWEVLQAAHDQ